MTAQVTEISSRPDRRRLPSRKVVPLPIGGLADFACLLGDDHPSTLTARTNLALSYAQAGRIGDAITIEETVVSDRVRLLGVEHPDTLTARGSLALSYWQAGRIGEAITLKAKVVADAIRMLGAKHPHTVMATNILRVWEKRQD